jgi:hypothetical protein
VAFSASDFTVLSQRDGSMCSWRSFKSPQLALCGALALFGFAGCTGTQSADDALNKAIESSGVSKSAVSPLGGKVTIDGQPPKLEQGQRLIVMLNDSTKLDAPNLSKVNMATNADGDFSFSTYKKDDGVKPGKYIVTFAILQKAGKKGLKGPDLLKNQFNDPDVNQKNTQFVIDHQAPGKKDYVFDLVTAGKEPVTAPGPHALTDLSEKLR